MGLVPRGPEQAEVLIVGNKVDWKSRKQGILFAGAEGALLDKLCESSGLDKSKVRLTYLDNNPNALHREVERACKNGLRLIITLGDDPLTTLLPNLPYAPSWSDEEKEKVEKKQRVMSWRGSLLPLKGFENTIEGYEGLLGEQDGVCVLPSYDLATVVKQIGWFTIMAQDFTKANNYLRRQWQYPPCRKWTVNDYDGLEQFVTRAIGEGRVAIDTEMSPYYIVALVTKNHVSTFRYVGEKCKEQLQRLMSSKVLKVAHNVGHDWTFFVSNLGIPVSLPHCDTGGHAHILNSTLSRALSPGISTRYTTYPFHKWLVDCDPKIYCGWDTVVCYDALLQTEVEIEKRGLEEVSKHDHETLWDFLQMQWKGFTIDERIRRERCEDYKARREEKTKDYERAVREILITKRSRLLKPHLFYRTTRCPCCGGGSVSRGECWRCAGYTKKPGTRRLQSENIQLGHCIQCEGRGSTERELPINPSSTEQKADILYRCLRMPARRYRGNITTRADQLAPLADDQPLVKLILDLSRIEADIETLERLCPDFDGRIHSVFDPWGTISGRANSSEGLLQKGTNVQNIPKRARDIIVADSGKLLIAPDMAQIEGRCVAVVSKDQALQTAYQEPINWPGSPRDGVIDSHTYVQQLCHRIGICISRDQSKRCAFGLFYGGAAEQMGKELTAEYFRKGEGCAVTTTDMQHILNTFFSTFIGLPRWRSNTFSELARTRKLQSPTGRVRHWLGYIINRRTRELVGKVGKEALSFFPQDMAAWVVACGLREMHVRGKGLLEPLIQVHDEIVTQIPASPGRIVDEACALAVDCMTQNIWGMDFPAEAEGPSKNWKEAK